MTINNISAVTCTKDRHYQLIKTIKFVEKINGLKEHIILDWDSKNEFNIEDSKKHRKKIYYVKNEKRWWLTRAYNTCFFIAKSEYILKLDADVFINYKKFNNLDYSKYDLIIFYDKPNDPGNFLITKKLLDAINGFNEYMWEWGWSDHDLINRAKEYSKESRVLEIYGYIDKIPHDNEKRSIIKLHKIFNNEKLFYYALIKSHNDINAYLAKKIKWSNKYKLNYKIEGNKVTLTHFYSIKNLSTQFKIVYKFKFFFNFFKIYKSKNRIQKYLFPIICFLIPQTLLQKFSLQIYPKK